MSKKSTTGPILKAMTKPALAASSWPEIGELDELVLSVVACCVTPNLVQAPAAPDRELASWLGMAVQVVPQATRGQHPSALPGRTTNICSPQPPRVPGDYRGNRRLSQTPATRQDACSLVEGSGRRYLATEQANELTTPQEHIVEVFRVYRDLFSCLFSKNQFAG